MCITVLQKEAKIMFSTPQYNIILDSQEIIADQKTTEGNESSENIETTERTERTEELGFDEKVKQLNQVMSLRKR